MGPYPPVSSGAIAVGGDRTGVYLGIFEGHADPAVADAFCASRLDGDWGRAIGVAPWLSHRTGMGLILGGGPVLTRYGFERVPYAYRIALRAGYAFGTSSVNADVLGDFRFARPGLALQVRAEALPGDAVHFFGTGNATPRTEPTEFYTLRQESYRVEPRLVFGADRRIEASVGGTLRVRSSDTDRPSLAGLERPYGFGNFTEIGLVAGLDLDGRDDEFYPVLGARVRVDGEFFPAIGDVTEAFATVHGVVSGYLGSRVLPGTPVLAVTDGSVCRECGIGPLNSNHPQLAGKRLTLKIDGNQVYYAHLSRIVVRPPSATVCAPSGPITVTLRPPKPATVTLMRGLRM